MKRRNTLPLTFSLLFLPFTLASCEQNNATTDPTEDQTKYGFSEATYTYDKNVANDLELPIELGNYNLVYFKLNDEFISSKYFSYDHSTKCIVVDQDYILTLATGEYDIIAISDKATGGTYTAKLTIINTLETSFDENNVRNYTFGKDDIISFNCSFGGATIKEISDGTNVIDSSLYEVKNNALVLNHEIFDQSYGTKTYTLTLSNNEVYDFVVSSNITFNSNYDTSTIHDTLVSTVGINPLYQYNDGTNVSIIDGTSFGMEGNVLKYIPNYTQNSLDCHGIYTLRNTSTPDCLWYDGGFEDDGFYNIQFDYMTIDSTVGNFCVKTLYQDVISPLLIGEENNNVLHHYSLNIKGEDITGGLYIYAFFENGSGYLLCDNFQVTKIENEMELGVVPDYVRGEDLNIPLTDNGYQFTIIDDSNNEVNDYRISDNTLTISSSYLDTLEEGNHKFTIKYALGEFEFNVYSQGDNYSFLAEKEANYESGKMDTISLKGKFSENLSIESINQSNKNYDSHYIGGWEFYHYDLDYNYKDLVALVKGDDGSLVLSKEFLDKVDSSQDFTIKFSNGYETSFRINSNRSHVSNYDDKTVMGDLGNQGVRLESPLSQGMANGAFEIIEKSPNDNALYLTDTKSVANPQYYTIKLHDHVWEWYRIDCDATKLCRIEFDYQINNINDNIFFKCLALNGEDIENNFFNYDEISTENNDGDEVRWYLNNDGGIHHFDTGWFTYSDNIRLFNLVLPQFGDGQFVMLDNFSFSQTKNDFADLTFLNGEDFSINTGYTINNILIDNKAYEFNKVDDDYVISKELLNDLALGSHSLSVETNVGKFLGNVSKITDETVILNETYKEFKAGDAQVKLSGEFSDSVKVVGATKHGSHVYDPDIFTGIALNCDDFVVESDGLVITSGVLDYLYGSTRIDLSFSNGSSLSITLENNCLIYSDFNNTRFWDLRPGNNATCQDTNMMSIEQVENNQNVLVYRPKNAVLPHSVGVNTRDNGFYTIWNTNANPTTWSSLNFESGKTYRFTVNYDVSGDNDSAYVVFSIVNKDGTFIDSRLTSDKHEFTIEAKGDDIQRCYFFAPISDRAMCNDLVAKIYSYQIIEVVE